MDLEACHEICSRFVREVEALGPDYACECGICTDDEYEPVTARVKTSNALELIRLLATHLHSTALHLGWDAGQIIRLALTAAQLAISEMPEDPQSTPGILS